MLCKMCKKMTDIMELFSKKGFLHYPSLFELSESALLGCEFCVFLQEQISSDRWDDLSRCKLRKTPDITTSWTPSRDAEIRDKIMAVIGKEGTLHCTPVVLRTEDRSLPGFRHMKVVLDNIYRDSSYSYRFESDFEIFINGDSPFARYIRGRPISHSSSSDESFQLATSWLRECIQNHPMCGNQDSRPLPTRVIDVGPPDGSLDPFLFVSKGQVGNWLTLSDCWGQIRPFQTTTQNLQQFTRGIPFNDLPASFQDAVTITRRLNYRYLWIDALCIIQDSQDDWRTEAGQMHAIYRHSTLTIVADAAIDSTCGIFASADSRRQQYCRTVHLPNFEGMKMDTIMKARRSLTRGNTPLSAVSKRGWTLQEDILSPRILRYSAEQLFWACQTLRCCEADPHLDNWLEDKYFRRLNTRNSFFDRNDGDTETDIYFKFWREIIVQSFMKRSLTYQTDTLLAVAGLAKEIELRTKCTYVAGLWVEDMPAALLWKTNRLGRRPTEYIAPSWSWASIIFQQTEGVENGQTYNFLAYPDESIYDATVLCVYVEPVTDDAFGQIKNAFLTIAGNWRHVDDFKTLAPPFFERYGDLRTIWDKVVGHSNCLLPKQVVCNMDDAPNLDDDIPNLFDQGIIYLQILPDAFRTIRALILAPEEAVYGYKTYRRIGIAQIPLDDGMADDWEMGEFMII